MNTKFRCVAGHSCWTHVSSIDILHHWLWSYVYCIKKYWWRIPNGIRFVEAVSPFHICCVIRQWSWNMSGWDDRKSRLAMSCSGFFFFICSQLPLLTRCSPEKGQHCIIALQHPVHICTFWSNTFCMQALSYTLLSGMISELQISSNCPHWKMNPGPWRLTGMVSCADFPFTNNAHAQKMIV